MKPAIVVDGVSKQYVVRTASAGGYRTLREKMTETAVGYGLTHEWPQSFDRLEFWRAWRQSMQHDDFQYVEFLRLL